MVRSLWNRTIIASLACAGLLCTQPVSSFASNPAAKSRAGAAKERVVTVQEPGKPNQKCKIVKVWETAEGATAYQVQSIESGEMMTIVESGPPTTVPGSNAGTRVQAIATRIHHWGQSKTPPPNSPIPPEEIVETVVEPKSAPAPVIYETPTPRTRTGVFALFGKKEQNPSVHTAIAEPAEVQKKPALPTLSNSAIPTKDMRAKAVKAPAQELKLPVADKEKTIARVDMDAKNQKTDDWRKSWGKADDHKSEKVTSKKTTASPKTEVAPKIDAGRPDPLQAPLLYSSLPKEIMPSSSASAPGRASMSHSSGVHSAPVVRPNIVKATLPPAEGQRALAQAHPASHAKYIETAEREAASGGNAFSPSAPVKAPQQQLNAVTVAGPTVTPVTRPSVGLGQQTVQHGSQVLSNIQQMQGVLRDSLYPSQREWAVESMAKIDWAAHPEVIQALLTAAKDDPAVSVRAASVRSLGKMNAATAPVIQAVHSLKSDPDSRVRQEAAEAFEILVPARR